jgi:hypothetical protein
LQLFGFAMARAINSSLKLKILHSAKDQLTSNTLVHTLLEIPAAPRDRACALTKTLRLSLAFLTVVISRKHALHGKAAGGSFPKMLP